MPVLDPILDWQCARLSLSLVVIVWHSESLMCFLLLLLQAALSARQRQQQPPAAPACWAAWRALCAPRSWGPATTGSAPGELLPGSCPSHHTSSLAFLT